MKEEKEEPLELKSFWIEIYNNAKSDGICSIALVFLDSVIVIIIGAKKNRIPIAIFKT